jgi:hypothetical protein
MTAVYGLYSSPNTAQRAFDQLRKAGIADRDITILSSEPFEEYAFGQRDRENWMTWIAAGGGLVGLVTAYLLTSITQQVWPIDTGGMPVVTNWSNLIVIFELTMLGAVITTVITLLITARIPNWKEPALYDPAVSDGKILIGVANPSNSSLVEKALRSSGGGLIKTIAP